MESSAGVAGIRRSLQRIFLNEDVNFLLTNRIPRLWLTHLVGRISRIRHPLVCRTAIGLWKLFTDLDFAALDDIGWDVTAVPLPSAAFPFVAALFAAGAAARRGRRRAGA